MNAILEMIGIVKQFSGQEVLHGVDLSVLEGEVHALVGESGAGKSTLMRILMGELSCEKGKILLEGKEAKLKSPARALRSGIAMIHQEPSPVPEMTISENIYLGREANWLGVLNTRKQNEMTLKHLRELGIHLNPQTKMKHLSVAEAQMIEVTKAISYESRILIMDEPTSALSESEVKKLFETILLLKSRKVAVIYITHRLDELYQIADRVTILRDGYRVDTRNIKGLSKRDIIRLMVGREISEVFPAKMTTPGRVVLSVRDFSRQGEFENIRFDLHEGEILGVAGLMGSGRTAIVSALFGEHKADKGRVIVRGCEIGQGNITQSIQNRIAFVPEDRKVKGLNLKGNVQDNVLMVIYHEVPNGGLLVERANRKMVESVIKSLKIKTTSFSNDVLSLSGGNQQKVLIAKWLITEPEIFILDEPTRGIDVGAKADIYRLIGDLAASGKAIILISSEMQEVIGLCRRAIVLCEGKMVGELSGMELTQERIMALASGAQRIGEEW
jgi:inositol transport system ATP-binding protein